MDNYMIKFDNVSYIYTALESEKELLALDASKYI